jgi:transposase
VTLRKGKDVIRGFIHDLEVHCIEALTLRLISMEMPPDFVAGVRESLPAEALIFDRYHDMEPANDANANVRKAVAREKPYLRVSKSQWLRNPNNLSVTHDRWLIERQTLTHRIANAYGIVLCLRAFSGLPKNRQKHCSHRSRRLCIHDVVHRQFERR